MLHVSIQMTRLRLLLIVTLLVAMFGLAGLSEQVNATEEDESALTYSDERIIVKFKKGVKAETINRLVARYSGKLLGTDHRLGFSKIRSKQGLSIRQQVALFRNDPHVAYAEPDYAVSPEYVPNDPSYSSQWHLPKMNVPAAWDRTTGNASVVIAIVDTGVDADHVDLMSKFVSGYNTISNSTNWNDDHGHGTHVAGIAAGVSDNGIGTAGVCIGCRIMPIKAMGSNGSGYVSDIAEGVRWAADNGAKIINLSLGSPTNSFSLQDAITYAFNKGCLIIAAAGNDNSGNAYYPAANANVVAVAATDSNNNRASFSNYGAHVDVSAPGVSILATTFDGGYGYKQGTSMAAPNVAGVAGLIWSFNPSMTAAQIEQLLKDTATDLGNPGKDDYYGFGLINAQAALNGLTDSTAPSVPTGLSATARSTSISLSWLASTDNVGVTSYEVFQGATNIGTTTSTGFTATGLTTNQSYTFTVRAKDAAGNSSAASSGLTAIAQVANQAYRHTITLDKLNDFNGNTNVPGNETFSTSTAGFFSYVTWDATNIYLGYNGADFASSSTHANFKWLLLYVGGNGGTRNGVTYNTQTPGLPFAAKYHIRYKADGSYFNRMEFNSGSWADAGTYASTAAQRSGDGYLELRIPRADLGNPTQLQLVAAVINERGNSEWTWAATPGNAVSTDGYDRDLQAFYEFDLSASVAAAAQVYNYQLTRTGNTANSASLSFVAQTGANNVKIQLSTNGGANWSDATTSASLNAASTNATVTGLSANTDYKFRLVVTGGNNEGSSTIVNESMFVDLVAPSAPSGLAVQEKTATTIRFSWNAASDNVAVSGYDVYRGATLLGTTGTTSYTASGLTADTAYTFTVRAKDAAGNQSAASSPLNVSTNPLIMPHTHTIVLDGNNDFFSQSPDARKNETFSTSTANHTFFTTWDATHLYVAYHSLDVTGTTSNASQKWMLLYFGGSGGTTTGVNYSGQQPSLPFAAKYHIRFKVDGSYTNRQMWNGTSWQDMGNYAWGSDQARNDGNRFYELKIPRTHLAIDNAKTLQMVAALAYEDPSGNTDAMWAAVPSNAFANGDGFDRDFAGFFEFDLSASNGPAAQVFNHQFVSSTSNANSATFTFLAPTGATDVKIQQSTDGGTTWTTSTVASALGAASTNASVTGLVASTPYKFRLQVIGGSFDGSSTIVNLTLTPDTTPPTVPSQLAASGLTAFGFTLTWNASTDTNTGLKEYAVYRDGVLLAKTTVNSFVVSGLEEYTLYAFTVHAEDVAGNVSAASTVLNVRTLDITAPLAPAIVEYSAVSGSGFTVSWSGATDGGAGIKEYDILLNGVAVATVGAAVNQRLFSGLAEFTNYVVSIRVRDLANNVAASDATVSVRTLDVSAPSVPNGLAADALTSSEFLLSWNPSTDAGSGVSAYQVFNGATLVTTILSDTEYEMSGLTPNSIHSMTVRALDNAGNLSAASSALVVQLLNNWSDLTLSQSSIVENSAIDSIVGTLTAPGAEEGLEVTFTLVSGTGDDDNESFNISGNSLRISASFDFESKSSYSVRVKATDTNGASAEKVFVITVTDVNEAPTDVTLSAGSLLETDLADKTVGTLSAVDVDAGDTIAYALVNGTGSGDNASFVINGSTVRLASGFTGISKSSYTMRVRATDASGLSLEKAFVISVTAVKPTLTNLELSSDARTIFVHSNVALSALPTDINRAKISLRNGSTPIATTRYTVSIVNQRVVRLVSTAAFTSTNTAPLRLMIEADALKTAALGSTNHALTDTTLSIARFPTRLLATGGVKVAGDNRSVELLLDTTGLTAPSFSAAAGVSGLRATVALTTNGRTFQPLTEQDQVSIDGNKLTVTFQNALSNPTTRIQLVAGSLKLNGTNNGNLNPAILTAALDLSPTAVSTTLSADNRVISVRFSEAIAAVNAGTLKESITIATSGNSFVPLVEAATVRILKDTLQVTLPSGLSGSSTRLKIAAGAIQDTKKNQAVEHMTAAIVADGTGPIITAVGYKASDKTITVYFNEPIVLRSPTTLAGLAAAITYNGSTPLVAPTATINQRTLVIRHKTTLMSAMPTSIHIPANLLQDVAGNPNLNELNGTPDATGPVMISNTLSVDRRELTVVFNEAIAAVAKAGVPLTSITIRANGVTQPLGGANWKTATTAVSIVNGNTLRIVGLKTALAAGNEIVIRANAVADGALNANLEIKWTVSDS